MKNMFSIMCVPSYCPMCGVKNTCKPMDVDADLPQWEWQCAKCGFHFCIQAKIPYEQIFGGDSDE